jgi:hypothetical protein
MSSSGRDGWHADNKNPVSTVSHGSNYGDDAGLNDTGARTGKALAQTMLTVLTQNSERFSNPDSVSGIPGVPNSGPAAPVLSGPTKGVSPRAEGLPEKKGHLAAGPPSAASMILGSAADPRCPKRIAR